jgi:hypothetical protein
MRSFIFAFGLSFFLIACDSGESGETETADTVTNAVINAEGAENNAYNLPGSDTGAIHENTSEPGVLDKDARDTTQVR